ncbi:hypothetical protein ACET3Z_005087 [Daucus carota]
MLGTLTHKENVWNPNKKDLQSEKLPRNVVKKYQLFCASGPSLLTCHHSTPCITDFVMEELEKLGQKYQVALRIAKDPQFERLPCTHKGTYADDCLVERVTQHKCYMVATCDRDLKRRIRKIPGVPIMYITKHKYSIERLPEATMGGGVQLQDFRNENKNH